MTDIRDANNDTLKGYELPTLISEIDNWLDNPTGCGLFRQTCD